MAPAAACNECVAKIAKFGISGVGSLREVGGVKRMQRGGGGYYSMLRMMSACIGRCGGGGGQKGEDRRWLYCGLAAAACGCLVQMTSSLL